jgi:hypothetical protein
MWRFLAGVGCAVLLMGGGILIWQGVARSPAAVVPAAAVPVAQGDAGVLAMPPQATEASREQKRFNRYDHDRSGSVSSEEYLAARRKAFAKLDTDGDGRLSFDEWAIKARTKFAAADADHSGILTPVEFATTRVARKATKLQPCAPAAPEAD